jgi:hypothetical protein
MLDLFEADTLHNDQYADYRWGRYRIVLHELSGFEKPAQFIAGLAGQFQSVGNWKDEAEFRAFVSVAHEIVHYLQDLTTGVGHWDYVQRRRATDRALTELRARTWGLDPHYTLDEAAATLQLQEFAEASLRNLYPQRQPLAHAALTDALSKYAQYQPAEEHDYDLALLLELDAVVSVYCALSELRLTPTQLAIRDKHRNIWWPLKMAPAYQRPFLALLHAFALMMNGGAPLDAQAIDKALTVSCSLIPVFLDMAFAYPPPTYFADRPADRPHFEPGLRLVRMLRRFQQDGVGESVLSKAKPLDDAVRTTAEYTYPSIVDVYSDWAKYFAGSSNALQDWRRELAEQHAADPLSAARRSASSFLQRDIPLFMQAPDGTTHIISTNRLILDTDGRLYYSLLAAERDLQLFSVAVDGSPRGYVCPYDAHDCKGFTANCHSGHASLRRLPRKDCLVRDNLHDLGFEL